MQHPVYPVAYAHALPVGLHVDVARALLNRSLDQHLGDADDRRLVCHIRDPVGVYTVLAGALLVLVRPQDAALPHRLG